MIGHAFSKLVRIHSVKDAVALSNSSLDWIGFSIREWRLGLFDRCSFSIFQSVFLQTRDFVGFLIEVSKLILNLM